MFPNFEALVRQMELVDLDRAKREGDARRVAEISTFLQHLKRTAGTLAYELTVPSGSIKLPTVAKLFDRFCRWQEAQWSQDGIKGKVTVSKVLTNVKHQKQLLVAWHRLTLPINKVCDYLSSPGFPGLTAATWLHDAGLLPG